MRARYTGAVEVPSVAEDHCYFANMPFDPRGEIHRLDAEMNSLIAQPADLERRIGNLQIINDVLLPGLPGMMGRKVVISRGAPRPSVR